MDTKKPAHEAPKKKKNLYIALAVGALVATAASIGIAVGVSSGGSSSDENSDVQSDGTGALSSSTSENAATSTARSSQFESTDQPAVGTDMPMSDTEPLTQPDSAAISAAPPTADMSPEPASPTMTLPLQPMPATVTDTASPPVPVAEAASTTTVPADATTGVPFPDAAAPAVAGTPAATDPAEPPSFAGDLIVSAPSGTWTTLPDVPVMMGEVSTGVLSLDGTPYLVVLGEHKKSDDSYEADNGVTMLLDLTAGTWTRGGFRPEVGNHHASEVIDNKMYLFGGLSGGAEVIQVGELVSGPTGADIQWSILGDMFIPTGSGCTAQIGGLVYYCGGIDGDNTMTLPDCAAWDPATGTWDTSVEPMPEGRNHAATCSDGTSMFIFGGRSGKNAVGEGFSDVQIFTPGAGWQMGTPLPGAPRGGMGKAVYHEGKCYVFGGEVWPQEEPSPVTKVNEERAVYRVDVYDIASGTWSEAPDMPTGRHGIFPVEVGGVVIIAAGGTEAGASQSVIVETYTL